MHATEQLPNAISLPNDVPTLGVLLEQLGWEHLQPLELDNKCRRAYDAFVRGGDPDYANLPSVVTQAGYHLSKNSPVASVKRERDQHVFPDTLREYFDAWWLLVLHLTAKAYGKPDPLVAAIVLDAMGAAMQAYDAAQPEADDRAIVKATTADLNRAIDKARDEGLVVREICMSDVLFADLFPDVDHVNIQGIPVMLDVNAQPDTFYLFTKSLPFVTKRRAFDGPDAADAEHAWWGEIATRSLDDPNEAFHAGFQAGAVWQHNRTI